MDAVTYIQRRKARYMAGLLQHFEDHVEPHLPLEGAGAAQDFKGAVRKALADLSTDAEDLLRTRGEQNGLALDLRDAVAPTR